MIGSHANCKVVRVMDHLHKCIQEFTTQRLVVATQFKVYANKGGPLPCTGNARPAGGGVRNQAFRVHSVALQRKMAFEGKSSERQKWISVQQHCH